MVDKRNCKNEDIFKFNHPVNDETFIFLFLNYYCLDEIRPQLDCHLKYITLNENSKTELLQMLNI